MRKRLDMPQSKWRAVTRSVPEFQRHCPALICVTLKIERAKIGLVLVRCLVVSYRVLASGCLKTARQQLAFSCSLSRILSLDFEKPVSNLGQTSETEALRIWPSGTYKTP